MFESLLKKDWWYILPPSTIYNETSSSATIFKLLLHYVSIKFLYWTPLFFSFSSDFFVYQLDSSVFWPVWVFSFLLLSILGSSCFIEFLFIVLFRTLGMLVNVNKAKFSPRKILIIFSRIPTWGAPCLRLSLHHEKY